MSLVYDVPAAGSDSIEHADWIELEAIASQNGSCSYEELATQIHISGTTDVMESDETDDEDAAGDLSYEVADRTWAEIERRHQWCGGDDGLYPFEVSTGSISLKKSPEASSYVFQLLLSHFGRTAGPTGTFGERIFEHLSSAAGTSYFGGETNNARHFRFGLPRPDRTGFETALNNLCRELNCGTVKHGAALMGEQQDSHLDVVVWRSFPDDREGKVIGFGQCATGKHWRDKLQELQPETFASEWLNDRFHPQPVRMFFLPHCVEDRQWSHVTINAGVVFDRCRTTQLTGTLDGELRDQCKNWSSHVIQQLRA
jgi:hypothetical protein